MECSTYLINAQTVPWTSRQQGRIARDERDLTAHIRAEKLDVCVSRVNPGQISSLYHFHHAREEIFYILEGEGTLRYGGEHRRVRPGDIVGCGTGPAGAHQFINDTDAPLVYLAISTTDPVEICEYPDSNKILAVAPGQDSTPPLRINFQRTDEVSYWHAEPLADDKP